MKKYIIITLLLMTFVSFAVIQGYINTTTIYLPTLPDVVVGNFYHLNVSDNGSTEVVPFTDTYIYVKVSSATSNRYPLICNDPCTPACDGYCDYQIRCDEFSTGTYVTCGATDDIGEWLEVNEGHYGEDIEAIHYSELSLDPEYKIKVLKTGADGKFVYDTVETDIGEGCAQLYFAYCNASMNEWDLIMNCLDIPLENVTVNGLEEGHDYYAGGVIEMPENTHMNDVRSAPKDAEWCKPGRRALITFGTHNDACLIFAIIIGIMFAASYATTGGVLSGFNFASPRAPRSKIHRFKKKSMSFDAVGIVNSIVNTTKGIKKAKKAIKDKKDAEDEIKAEFVGPPAPPSDDADNASNTSNATDTNATTTNATTTTGAAITTGVETGGAPSTSAAQLFQNNQNLSSMFGGGVKGFIGMIVYRLVEDRLNLFLPSFVVGWTGGKISKIFGPGAEARELMDAIEEGGEILNCDNETGKVKYKTKGGDEKEITLSGDEIGPLGGLVSKQGQMKNNDAMIKAGALLSSLASLNEMCKLSNLSDEDDTDDKATIIKNIAKLRELNNDKSKDKNQIRRLRSSINTILGKYDIGLTTSKGFIKSMLDSPNKTLDNIIENLNPENINAAITAMLVNLSDNFNNINSIVDLYDNPYLGEYLNKIFIVGDIDNELINQIKSGDKKIKDLTNKEKAEWVKYNISIGNGFGGIGNKAVIDLALKNTTFNKEEIDKLVSKRNELEKKISKKQKKIDKLGQDQSNLEKITELTDELNELNAELSAVNILLEASKWAKRDVTKIAEYIELANAANKWNVEKANYSLISTNNNVVALTKGFISKEKFDERQEKSNAFIRDIETNVNYDNPDVDNLNTDVELLKNYNKSINTLTSVNWISTDGLAIEVPQDLIDQHLAITATNDAVRVKVLASFEGDANALEGNEFQIGDEPGIVTLNNQSFNSYASATLSNPTIKSDGISDTITAEREAQALIMLEERIKLQQLTGDYVTAPNVDITDAPLLANNIENSANYVEKSNEYITNVEDMGNTAKNFYAGALGQLTKINNWANDSTGSSNDIEFNQTARHEINKQWNDVNQAEMKKTQYEGSLESTKGTMSYGAVKANVTASDSKINYAAAQIKKFGERLDYASKVMESAKEVGAKTISSFNDLYIIDKNARSGTQPDKWSFDYKSPISDTRSSKLAEKIINLNQEMVDASKRGLEVAKRLLTTNFTSSQIQTITDDYQAHSNKYELPKIPTGIKITDRLTTTFGLESNQFKTSILESYSKKLDKASTNLSTLNEEAKTFDSLNMLSNQYIRSGNTSAGTTELFDMYTAQHNSLTLTGPLTTKDEQNLEKFNTKTKAMQTDQPYHNLTNTYAGLTGDHSMKLMDPVTAAARWGGDEAKDAQFREYQILWREAENLQRKGRYGGFKRKVKELNKLCKTIYGKEYAHIR